MKKILVIFSAALLVCACAKESVSVTSDDSFSMIINASSDLSKTAIEYDAEDEKYIPSWTKGDAIQVLEFSGTTQLQNKTSEELSENCSEASFSVQLDKPAGTDFTYYAVYPASAYGKGGSGESTFYRLVLGTEQTYNTTTFGPGSDLLISGVYPGTETERPTTVNLKFKRIGAIVGITVKGMTAGETIESVTISNSDNYIAGFSKYSPTTAQWLGTYSSSSKSITTEPFGGTITTTGEDMVWFRTYGVTLETDLTISVTTNAAVYTKTIDLAGSKKTIEFKECGMTKFSVNNLTRTSRADKEFAKVIDDENLNVGERVIFVANVNSSYFAAGTLSGSILSPAAASLNNSLIKSDNALVFTLGKNEDNWTFSSDGQLLGATAVKTLAFNSGTTTWSIDISGSTASVSSTTNSYGTMKYNSSSPRFTTYTSGQTSIYLYTEVPASVVVTGTPDKKKYVGGEKFDPTGLTVTATYGDGSTLNVTNGVEWLCDPEVLSAGDNSCDVLADFYGVTSEVYTVADLSVSAAPTLVSISASGTPAEFWKGDSFNHNGITVTALFSDESERDVTEDSEFTAPDMTTAGEKTVTIKYDGKETSYNIEVKTIANTKEKAYTTSEAKTIIDAGKDLASEVYVKGTISKIDSFNETYGSITYWLDSNSFEVYGGLGMEGEAFTSKNDLTVNDDVIVYGKIKKFSSTYEFDKNNYLVERLLVTTLSIGNLSVKNGDAITPEISTNVEDYTISYTSDNPSVVSASGSTLTTKGTGTATIHAKLTKDGYKPSSTTFTVTVTTSAALVSITVSGSLTKTEYYTGTSLEYNGLTATGTYSDSSSQDLTSAVTWTADPATFNTAGNTTVTATATLGKISGSKDYSVTVKESPKTETLNVGDYATANSWKDGTAYKNASTSNVTFTASGTGNNCKYYSSDTSWRFYSSGNGQITITVPSGKKIVSVAFTGTVNMKTPDNWTKSSSTFIPNTGTNVNTVTFANGSNTSKLQTIAVSFE